MKSVRHEKGRKICKAEMEGGQVKEIGIVDQDEKQSSPGLGSRGRREM